MLLASGNITDIVGSSRLKDYANQFGPSGAFLPLNELIDKHAPHIKSFFDERPKIRQSITADDKNIYYIPNLPDGKLGRAYWLRTDWLDALNLEIPTTVEEYETVLRAFRNQDPNGNDIKDEIPFFARHWQELIRLVTLFGVLEDWDDYLTKLEDMGLGRVLGVMQTAYERQYTARKK